MRGSLGASPSRGDRSSWPSGRWHRFETVLRSQESPLRLTLFQGLAKGDKMDFVVQKAVELGAAEIVPFSSYHTVVKLGEKQQEAKRARWQRIALKRPSRVNVRVPAVGEVHTFAAVAARVKSASRLGELVVLAYEGEKQVGLRDLDAGGQAVSAVIGPEGDFPLQR